MKKIFLHSYRVTDDDLYNSNDSEGERVREQPPIDVDIDVPREVEVDEGEENAVLAVNDKDKTKSNDFIAGDVDDVGADPINSDKTKKIVSISPKTVTNSTVRVALVNERHKEVGTRTNIAHKLPTKIHDITPEKLFKSFHEINLNSSSIPSNAKEMAQKYDIVETSRDIKCQVNGTTKIGWIPASSTAAQKQNESLIPRFIFQSWKTNDLQEKICDIVLEWTNLNPEYDYFLFDDASMARFLQLEYGRDIYSAYSCIKVGAAKSDVWRLLIIYLFGGIYFDIDVLTKVPFEKWGFENRTVVSGRACHNRRKHPTGCGHQWGLIYSPNHPLIRTAIETTLGNLARREADHVYGVSFTAFIDAWKEGPFNSSYMPRWGDFMGGRVSFSNKDAKDAMMAENGHWTESKGREAIWEASCIYVEE